MSSHLQTIFKDYSSIHIASSKGQKHVALISGGMSAEREVSKSSAGGIEKALVNLGYQVTHIDMGANIAEVLAEIKPDVVFNALHGTYGEDGALQGLLNILRIPYTHSGLLASAIAFNKSTAKDFFASKGILQAQSILVKKTDDYKTDPMPRPYVIKPLTQGSSVGIELVFEEDHFSFANYEFSYGDVIIEEYIKGREMQVAILNGEALGALEIQLINKRFYDFEAKYTEGFTRHLLPAPIAENDYQKLLKQSEEIYKSLGCKGLARVEFIYDELAHDFYLLEINTHPGFTPLSICPEIAAYKGMDFEHLVEEVLKTADFEL